MYNIQHSTHNLNSNWQSQASGNILPAVRCQHYPTPSLGRLGFDFRIRPCGTQQVGYKINLSNIK